MNKEIQKIILEQTDQRKAEMYCELNRWKWPPELEKFNPGDYGTRQDSWRDAMPIMDFIQGIVGDKATSREWNKDNMTNEEHEVWYREHREFYEGN